MAVAVVVVVVVAVVVVVVVVVVGEFFPHEKDGWRSLLKSNREI